MENIALGIIIAIIFISLIVLFCVLLIKLYIRKIRNYTRLIYQKDIDFQKNLNTTIIETQEQVLNNISHDLHDDVGQQITFINFFLENAKMDTPELKDILDPISNSVRNLSESVRRISHSLNNQVLLQEDLYKSIKTEINRLQAYNRIEINYNEEFNEDKTFGTNEKIVIYRIFQEIINNSLKHSKASIINIEIKNSNSFQLIITDNGKGFDYKTVKEKNKGLGLKNIIERAQLISFSIDIESGLGSGTKITLSQNL